MDNDSTPLFGSHSTTKGIPLSRLMIYALVVALLIPVLTWIYASSSIDTAESALFQLKESKDEIIKMMNEQASNRLLMVRYSHRDPFFLAKNIETFKTLQKEEDSIRSLINQGGMPELVQQERRLKFLSSGDNSFSFVESGVTVSPFFKETTETQGKVVELDESDLIQVLSRIEGKEPKNSDDPSLESIISTRPQLFISEATLDRKKGYDREVWALSMKLVKRMYTNPPSLQLKEPSSLNKLEN